MSKKQHRKSRTNAPPKSAHSTAPMGGVPDFFSNVKVQSWLIFAFAFMLYANTLQHGFVYDDGIVITENKYTQQGFEGFGGILSHDTFFGFYQKEGLETLVEGGRYRPMSLLLFASLYQFVGAEPFLFHLVTVLLFSMTCVLLYRTLIKLLIPAKGPPRQTGPYMLAWLAALLFAAHPIHTEVVANIKGCDEILALLGCLAALNYTLKAWDTRQQKWAIAAGVSFFFACLSKENAVAYALLIPLALWFFRDNDQKTANASIWRSSLPVFISLVAFLVIRGSILPWSSSFGGGGSMQLMNNPFLKFEGNQWVRFAPAEKLATIFYTLWKYIQLLFVPHPLTHDYYPRHIGMMSFGNPLVLLSLAVYGFMAYWVLRNFKQRDTAVFCILLFLLPLGIVSNLIFPVGTNMGERFAFMPSVGFCFLIGMLLTRYLDKNRSLVLGIFGLSIVLFSIKTIFRNTAWESNDRLFMTDVQVSENSAKLQNACGQLVLTQAKEETNAAKKRALCQEAISRVNRALQIYPEFNAAVVIRAGAYMALQQFPDAIADYRLAYEMAPADPQRKTMLAFALREGGKYYGQQKNDLANAFKYMNESWQLNPKDPETARLLGVANYVQGKQAEAVAWYTKAEVTAPNDAGSLWDLSLAYANLGMNDKATELQQRALAIDPKIAQKAASGEAVDR